VSAEPRPRRSERGYAPKALSRSLAVASALALGALYALIASSDPGQALRAFFLGPFSSSYSFLSLLESSAPLLCCALGAGIAFRAGAFNLGGEGQAAVGSLAAGIVAVKLGEITGLPPALGAVAVLAAAALAGALLAWLSALAEARTGAEVMLTSFLLSQVAIVASNWAIGGPLKESGANLLAMPVVPERFRLTLLAPPSPLSAAFPIAVVLALAMIAFTRATRAGTEMRMLGKNPAFARATGLGSSLKGCALAASGALAGLGGALLVLGQAGRAVVGMTGGVGWNGLAVALVGGSDGLGSIPAALFFAWLDSGARQASVLADLSPDASSVLEAFVLFLVTAKLSGRRFPSPFRGRRREAAVGGEAG
jgi:riboflavin transport system permease protein